MAHRAARRTGGSQRLTDWSASTPLTGLLTVAAGTKALLEIFAPLSSGETIVRTRGMYAYGSDQEGVDEFYTGAFGIGVVTKVAAAIGITAIPGPATDAAWDGWLFHSYFAGQVIFASGVGFQDWDVNMQVIDSKAMRKVTADDRLVVVVENTVSTTGFEIGHAIRILSKPF